MAIEDPGTTGPTPTSDDADAANTTDAPVETPAPTDTGDVDTSSSDAAEPQA